MQQDSTYSFDAAKVHDSLVEQCRNWFGAFGYPKWVVGISGGKDSTFVAGLGAEVAGPENVIGVMMPCGEQADIDDSVRVCKTFGIEGVTVNIGRACDELMDEIVFGALRPVGVQRASNDTRINLPARLRMSVLYAVAQSVGGMVLNTSNLTENVLGYSTLYGDHAGSFAPIGNLTVTEVLALGDWMGMPRDLIHKTPMDGLQPLPDEARLGFRYADVDRYIRCDEGDDAFKENIAVRYLNNRFKTDIVRIPAPVFDFPNFVQSGHGG